MSACHHIRCWCCFDTIWRRHICTLHMLYMEPPPSLCLSIFPRLREITSYTWCVVCFEQNKSEDDSFYLISFPSLRFRFLFSRLHSTTCVLLHIILWSEWFSTHTCTADSQNLDDTNPSRSFKWFVISYEFEWNMNFHRWIVDVNSYRPKWARLLHLPKRRLRSHSSWLADMCMRYVTETRSDSILYQLNV